MRRRHGVAIVARRIPARPRPELPRDAGFAVEGFDFSYDTNLVNELGRINFERARMERGGKRREQRKAYLERSRLWFDRVLEIDPENQSAHHNLALVYSELGDTGKADYHRQLHDRFRPDDYAIEKAVTRHRQNNPAADHAAAPFVIHDLNRPQAYGMNGNTPPLAKTTQDY